jgi:FkbM family methyltransferase
MRYSVILKLKDDPSFRPAMIFDVGANVGQSAKDFAAVWPEAEIRSFEPILESFKTLVTMANRLPNVRAERLAFSSYPHTATMLSRGTSLVNRIIEKKTDDPVETVECSTIDGYCEKHRIDRIDFLKIDAEGHDLQVLIGAANLLRARQVEYICIESGLTPDNRAHVPFEILLHFLGGFGYRLFGLYDLEERHGKRGAAFGNAVFVRA